MVEHLPEFFSKFNENIDLRQGKRRLTSHEEVKNDLNLYLVKLFNSFKGAINMYNEKFAIIPPHKMVRNYSATNFNQCLVSNAFMEFPQNCFFGKYKRFYLNINGYTIQFKKLNNKGLPMNIKTGNVENIANQLSLDFFGDTENYNPILFFGYKTDEIGNFVSPQILYIDEGKIKFRISEDQINIFKREVLINSSNLDVDSNDVKIKNVNLKKKII